MATERAAERYRRLYGLLLRLYPGTFRRRFAESMEQTFHDLCRDRREAGNLLFPFVLGLFAETTAGVLRERMALIMPPRKSVVRLAVGTAGILSVPLIAMQFTDEVTWSAFDFLAMGVLLFGTGLTFQIIARRSGSTAYRAATGLACATALLLVWLNLAVGLIGSEDNPANVLYLGVLYTGAFGAFVARLRPRGMARALFATALAQALVPLLAAMIWSPGIADGEGTAGLVGVIFLNGLFVLLFASAGVLFRQAGEVERETA